MRHLTTLEVAERLRVSASTVRRWRATGDGPPFVRIVGRPVYREIDLQAWLDERRVPPSDGGEEVCDVD